MSPVVHELLVEAEARLAGVDSPRLSAEVLVAHVLGCSRLGLVVDRSRVLSNVEAEAVESVIARRESGEPVAYILGEKEFYGLDFRVTPDVLIPRPETEHIVEIVESLYPERASLHFADLGTGSGILAVTLCTLFPEATGVAVDMSKGALDVARSNAVRHGVDSRLDFQLADFTKHLFDEPRFDLIVSNPPYVTEQEFHDASAEVTSFEPTMALVSGWDGLDHIRAMASVIWRPLKPGGHVLVEIGCRQGESVKVFFQEQFSLLKRVKVMKDLAGLDRVVLAQKK